MTKCQVGGKCKKFVSLETTDADRLRSSFVAHVFNPVPASEGRVLLLLFLNFFSFRLAFSVTSPKVTRLWQPTRCLGEN